MRYSDMEHIQRLVREAVELGQSNPNSDCTEAILEYASEIIEIVQGDKKMNKSQLVQEIHALILDGMDKTRLGGLESGDVSHDTAVQIVNDFFDGKVPATAEYVDTYYEMNPETEDILLEGTLLVDGMKVLIEGPEFRESITEHMESADISRARMRNRWCVVDQVKTELNNGLNISFIGVYEDGTKRKWTVPADYAWIVKKDSVPRIDMVLGNMGHTLFKGTIPKVLEFLKTTRDQDRANFTVLLGGDGDVVVPGDQYFLAKGNVTDDVPHVIRKADVADSEVFDENGVSVLRSTTYELLFEWAKSLPKDSKYLNYRLRLGGTDNFSTVKDFLEKFSQDDKEDLETDIHHVVDFTGKEMYKGAPEDVLTWLKNRSRLATGFLYSVRIGESSETVSVYEYREMFEEKE